MSRKSKRIWKGEEHQGWGNNIFFISWENRRLSGHTTPHPQVGDEYHCKMKSGKTGCFEFTKIEPCGKPYDMWFADVKDLDYLKP